MTTEEQQASVIDRMEKEISAHPESVYSYSFRTDKKGNRRVDLYGYRKDWPEDKRYKTAPFWLGDDFDVMMEEALRAVNIRLGIPDSDNGLYYDSQEKMHSTNSELEAELQRQYAEEAKV